MLKSKIKLIFLVLFVGIVAFKAVANTENMFSNYGQDTKLEKIMNDNSLNGGVNHG